MAEWIDTQEKRKIAQKVYVMLCIYAFLLFLLNYIRIFDNAFWADEVFTINLAKMSVSDMINATAADVHPPVYYLFAQLLYRIFGNNGITYHLSGLIPYAAIMVIGCTLVKKQFGFIPAAVMITMSSLMQNAVIANVEVRMYPLAALFVLIAYLAFYNIIEKNNITSWIVFCLSSLGAAYTHYYALISVAFLYALIIPLAIFQKKYTKGLIISYIVTILGYLPWLMILIDTFNRSVSNWWSPPIPTISGCYKYLLDYKWIAIFVLICIAFFVLYQAKILRVNISDGKKFTERIAIKFVLPKKIEFNKEIYWVVSGLISVCGTAVTGIALSYLVRPFFTVRYLFPVSAVLYLIIGVCISRMKLCRLWCAVLIISILCCNVPAYIQRYNVDANLGKGTDVFLNIVRPDRDDEIVSNNGELVWSLSAYYFPENDFKYDDSLVSLDTDYENIWLIWDGELDENAKANIENQNYTLEEIHEGDFANYVFYHVYKLSRN